MQTLHFAKSLINLITVLSFTAVKIFNHRKKSRSIFINIITKEISDANICYISRELNFQS